MQLAILKGKEGNAYYYMKSVRKPGKPHPTKEKVAFLGYEHDLLKKYENPKDFFKAEAKRISKEKSKKNEVKLTIDLNERYSLSHENEKVSIHDSLYAMGQFPLSVIYHELEIDQFLNNRRKHWGIGANADAIFKLLVFGRVLYPDSKLATWQIRKKLLFGNSEFTDDDIYRLFPFLYKYEADFIVHLNNKVVKQYNRDASLMYYDVTNIFFEIPHPDLDEKLEDGTIIEGIRKRGCSKEHRPDPIVQIGLFMDADGLPVDFGLFPGNNNDVTTFSPMIERAKETLKLNKMIYIADKGMMSGTNVANILAQKQGYIISDSVRKQSKTMQKYILDENGYQETTSRMLSIDIHNEKVKMDVFGKIGEYKGPKYQQEDVVTFKYKSRLYPTGESVWVDNGKKKVKVQINKRQIIFWSRDYQVRARIERAEAIKKAEKTGSVFNNHAANKYFKKEGYDPKTGEINKNEKFIKYLDENLIKEDEKLDGYYIIETNVVGNCPDEPKWKGQSRFRTYDQLFELNRTVTDFDIIDMYRGLWKIEESFRITKSYLEIRPAYVRKEESIHAHVLTCFVALLILRILEIKKLDSKIPYTGMIESLRNAQLGEFQGNLFKNHYYDWNLDAIAKATGLELNKVHYTKQELRQLNNFTKKVFEHSTND